MKKFNKTKKILLFFVPTFLVVSNFCVGFCNWIRISEVSNKEISFDASSGSYNENNILTLVSVTSDFFISKDGLVYKEKGVPETHQYAAGALHYEFRIKNDNKNLKLIRYNAKLTVSNIKSDMNAYFGKDSDRSFASINGLWVEKINGGHFIIEPYNSKNHTQTASGDGAFQNSSLNSTFTYFYLEFYFTNFYSAFDFKSSNYDSSNEEALLGNLANFHLSIDCTQSSW